MKKLILLLTVFCLFTAIANANYVNGYTKKDGTYVQGYYRSNSNNTKLDNYSTKGNINPYSGQAGTKTYNNYNNYGYQKNQFNNYNNGYRY